MQTQTLGALGSLAELTQGGEAIDLTTVQTEYPVLKAGIVPFTIVESKVEPGKTDPNKLNWILTLATKVDLISTKDKPVKAGHKHTLYIGLTATGKRTSDMVLSDCVRLFEAIWGEVEARKIDVRTFDLQSVVNADVMGRVGVVPETQATETQPAYPEKNDVKLVKKAV